MNFFNLQHLILVFLFAFLSSNPVYAADSNAGKNASIPCQTCHGIDGEIKSPLYPLLTGQRATYLEAQLKAFKSGARVNSAMQAIAAKLSEQEIKNISAFYSRLTVKKEGKSSTETKKRSAKFAMCAGCHGATAQGRGGFPKLAGQSSDYLKKQLLNFKSGVRKGGPMNAISSTLSEQDINLIVNFLASL